MTIDAYGFATKGGVGAATATITLKKGTAGGDYTTTSTSYADVDATNLKYTATIPTGWKLTVVAFCTMDVPASQNPFMAIADGGTVIVEEEDSTGIAVETFLTMSIGTVITGDGTSHAVSLQWKTSGGTLRMKNATSTFLPTMIFTLMPSN